MFADWDSISTCDTFFLNVGNQINAGSLYSCILMIRFYSEATLKEKKTAIIGFFNQLILIRINLFPKRGL